MTSLSLTEDELLGVLSNVPSSSFEDVASKLWKARQTKQVKPGSLSTISKALKNLHQKGFASYDVAERKWRITSLGRWIIGEKLVPDKSSALDWVTKPLFSTVQNQPEKLAELLSTMFVSPLARRDKFSEQEEMMVKQTVTKLTSIFKEYPGAFEKIWSEGVESLVGEFSSLMAAILLHRSSLSPDYNTQTSAATTIPKIVDQYFKFLSAELGEFLSNSLDPDKLAAHHGSVKADRSRQTRK